MISKISTKNMSREDWLAQRKHGIGGSDAAAILGMNEYSSAYSVWADKLGLIPDKGDSEAMRIGRDLEDYVAKRFTESTGKKVRRENAMIFNSDYPFALADVDRLIVGERAGLECKTTSSFSSEYEDGRFPDRFLVQCTHYMMVTGLDRWYLAVLVLGKGFYKFTLERDESEINALAAAESEFWELVKCQEAPAPDGTQATANAISALYPESQAGTECDLTGYESVLSEIIRLKAQKSSVEVILREKENCIKNMMKTAEKGKCGGFAVKYGTVHKGEYTVKPSTYRTLNIKQL